MRRLFPLLLLALLLGCAAPNLPKLCQTSPSRTDYVFAFEREVAKWPGDEDIDWEALQEIRRQRVTRYLQTLPGTESCHAVRINNFEGGGVGAVVQCEAQPRFDVPAGSWTCVHLATKK
jgi:hypothetical protein